MSTGAPADVRRVHRLRFDIHHHLASLKLNLFPPHRRHRRHRHRRPRHVPPSPPYSNDAFASRLSDQAFAPASEAIVSRAPMSANQSHGSYQTRGRKKQAKTCTQSVS
ncbi:unnamed protein product [Cercospora beticola]|nr:unnamed protein product [Cercospora beticola]